MTLNELKIEIASHREERMEGVFKDIKEAALSGESEVVFFNDDVEKWQMNFLTLLGYNVADNGHCYIVSGWV